MAHSASWLDTASAGSEADAARLQALQAAGVPDERNEHWAHAHLRAYGAVRRLSPVGAVDAARAAMAWGSRLPPAIAGAARLVLVDGHLQPALSDAAALRACAWLPHDTAPLALDDPDLRFALLGDVHAGHTLRLAAPAATGDSATHVELLQVFSGGAGSVYPRVQLQLAANATLTVIERFAGDVAADGLLCTALDVQLGAHARLALHRLHDCGPQTLMLDQLQVRLGAGSDCQVHQLSAGGANVRQSQSLQLQGRGASLRFLGASVQRASEYHDTLVRVRLDAPECALEHRYRALAADRAHLACSADVIVAAEARGARVRQSLRGLSDGRGAQVNLRPRLTIHTDDIQASHGATTGQLDETLLFYLLSRGIDAGTARAMLKWAFIGDVLSAIADPAIRRAAEEVAARHVADESVHELVGSLLA